MAARRIALGGHVGKPPPGELVVDHRGVDAGRMHRVDPNTVLRKQIRVYPHQPDHPVLGGGVADGARIGAAHTGQSRGRTDQHDRSAGALLDHGRYRDVDGVVDAGEVDVDDVAPAVVAGLHRGDAGVGHDDVEPAELVEAGPHCGRQRFAIADVGLFGHDAGAGVLDELDGGGQIVGGAQRIGHAGDLSAQVDRDDVRTVGRQANRVRAALAARSAGDEGDSPLRVAGPIRGASGPCPGRPRESVAAS